MTQEQAKKYLADPANWHVHQTGKYVQLEILTYKHIQLARICTYSCLNPWEVNRGVPLRYGWQMANNYREIKGGALGYGISQSEAWRMIWEASK